MCGRYERKVTPDEIIGQFDLNVTDGLFAEYKPSGEVFPGTNILSVNAAREPEWIWWTIRDTTYNGKLVSAINAKAETIQKVGMFRSAFKTDRVLIPATALFEWQVQPDDSKQRFRIWFDEPLFAFAGIARDCEIKGEIKRCTVIITTEPNRIFSEIHNTKQRQAVVIRADDYDQWLDPKAKPEGLKSLMKPLSASETHFEKAAAEDGQASLFG